MSGMALLVSLIVGLPLLLIAQVLLVYPHGHAPVRQSMHGFRPVNHAPLAAAHRLFFPFRLSLPIPLRKLVTALVPLVGMALIKHASPTVA